MPTTDTRAALVERLLAYAGHIDRSMDRVRLDDRERAYRVQEVADLRAAAALAAPPVSAAGEEEEGELRAKAAMHAVYQALYHSLTLLERGWDAPLGSEADDARRALRRAWVAITPAHPAYDRLVPEADVERKMFALWMREREEEIREANGPLYPTLARPAAVETHDLASGVLSDVVRALWTLDGFSHTNGNSVAEDVLDYAALRNCPAAGSAEREGESPEALAELISRLTDASWMRHPDEAEDMMVLRALCGEARVALEDYAALRGQGEG